MARLQILVHRFDRYRTGFTIIGRMARLWHRAGHHVVVAAGPANAVPADLSLLHVDLSVVPPEYVEASRRYAVSLNLAAVDIRKSAISRHRVASAQAYDGPVIVKSDLNSSGFPEYLKAGIAHRLGEAADKPPKLVPGNYPVYASPREVPPAVWDDRSLVVEKFLPEIEADGVYCVRYYAFFGSAEASFKMRGRDPLVKGVTSFAMEEIETPPAIRARREELGFDFGKFDYVQRDGEVILLDPNRTPGPRAFDKHGLGDALVQRLAAGLDAFL